jgi:putative DNA primase/helicase
MSADKDPDLLTPYLNDVGNAQRLLAVHGRNLRYCPPMRKWFIFDGHRFRMDEKKTILKLAQEVMHAFLQQAIANNYKDASQFALSSSMNAHRLDSAIRMAEPHVPISPHEMDTDPYLLNFLNGTLDLRSFELLPHSSERMITKLVHANYEPEAQCPRFDQFVERILGQLSGYVQKAIGYSLTGITSEKAVFLCYGKTNSGKTTFLELFRHLFEEYSTLIMVDALTFREHEDNNSKADLADLRGARFVMTSETEEGQRLKEGKLKRITQGQGLIKAVRKYENPIEFRETHKLWLDCNHKPVIYGTDDAIWRRLHLIPFERPLDDSEIDDQLPMKLRENEAKGIIAWGVRGTRRWQEERLGKIAQVDAATSNWRSEMDHLGAFRESRCFESAMVSVNARPLYQEYRRWAEEAGERPMTEAMFGARFAESFEKGKDGTGRIVYYGVALKTDCEEKERSRKVN